MELDERDLEPHKPLIHSRYFFSIALVTMLVGLMLMAYFFMYFATRAAHAYPRCSYNWTYKKENRSLCKELVVAFVSSAFLSCGSLFLLLWGVSASEFVLT